MPKVFRSSYGILRSYSGRATRPDGYVLTHGRYVGFEEKEDDGEPFEDKMKSLTLKLCEQREEAARLDAAIASNLKKLGYDL